jgi:hypothetical protein
MRGVGIIWSNLPTSATDLMADSDKLSRPRVPDVVVQAPQAEIGGDAESVPELGWDEAAVDLSEPRRSHLPRRMVLIHQVDVP